MQIFGRKSPTLAELYDPCDVIESSLDLVGQQLTLHNIEVTKEFPQEHNADVMGYKMLLEQVTINLITNARDAIMAHRKNASQCGHVKFRIADGENGHVEITVSDDGGGIPANVLDKLFDPFFTTKEIGSGTGLGLSISYGIIKDMKGTISARNAEEGAEFVVRIPKQPHTAFSAAVM